MRFTKNKGKKKKGKKRSYGLAGDISSSHPARRRSRIGLGEYDENEGLYEDGREGEGYAGGAYSAHSGYRYSHEDQDESREGAEDRFGIGDIIADDLEYYIGSEDVSETRRFAGDKGYGGDYYYEDGEDDDYYDDGYDYDDEDYDDGDGYGSRPKKKRKKKHYILKTLVAGLVAFGLYKAAMTSYFDIDNITVTGNSRFTAEQVIEASGIRKGGNLFKAKTFGGEKALKKDPYVKDADISRKLPGTIEITVEERSEDLSLGYKEKNVVISADRVVLRVTEDAVSIPVAEGLTLEGPKVGEVVSVKEDKLFRETLELVQNVATQDFYFKKIDVSKSGMKGYVLDTLTVTGSMGEIKKEMKSVRAVVYDLLAKGVMRGQVIVAKDGTCSFRPEISG
ncbi:MAG: FtsQ-type POTRA domain-containing protein [Clostridiales Family XIII bacterium]|nr:FtsQ-type POTRA domain-containing protein [Clostridiales Family XIII bacterium]